MRASAGRRGAFAVAAALSVVVGVAGCQSDGGGSKATGKPKAKAAQGAASPIDAVNAAYKKVSGYRSAKFRMDMTVPGAAAATGTTGAAGTKGTASSTITSSGTLGWNPMVMDMTTQGAALGMGVAGAPTTLHSLTTGTAMYTDMSGAIKNDPEFAKALGGKSWLKTDVGAAAAGSGSDAEADSALVDNSLQSNENPAQQLATLVAAPQISRVGLETVDGVKAEHYKGHLTMDQALKAGSNGKALTAEQREQVADSMRKAGITAEDIDVWIGADSFPVRTDVKMATAKGPVAVSEHLSGYSAKAATVKVPAAGQTFTVQDLLKIAQNS
ncbi:hypothetical protein [Streptomyces sp. 8L]|uniref:hypothetical protein n=1 Tax=Streptomyces sp. 8L TaxID=2877242 RepID=UPI001CD7677B|nr:hypothetical protein [Streptomyces sp. 8L]MCA1220871.1 hypothetical protein [Streptomyces sp. 8L]